MSRVTVVRLILVSALLLASCTGAAPSETASDTPPADGETPAAAGDTPTSADDSATSDVAEGSTADGEEQPSGSGGEVVFGFASDGGQLYDPHATASIAVGTYLSPVFDTLVTVQDDGEVAPALAESWEFSDDETTLTLELRDDVTFHDGSAFNAEAVVANIERGKTLATSAVVDQLSSISDVTADGDTTVVMTLDGAIGAVLPVLAGRAGMMVSPDAFENADLATNPVGTGPFAVSEESVPGSEMVYDAYSDYWDPSVQTIDRFVVSIVAPPAQTAGVIDGSVDIILMTSNPQDIPQVEEAGKSVTSTGMEYVYTIFLSKDGIFADQNVRYALSQALDREAIASSILLGQCEVTAQPFNPESFAAPTDLVPPEVDMEAAREVLANAGGPVTFVTSAAGTLLPSIAEAIQSMAGEAGLEVEVELLPPAQLLETYLGGEADGYFSTQTGDVDPSLVVSRLSTSLSPGGEPSDTLTSLAQDGENTSDLDERAEAYQQWATAYQEEAFHISLCQQDVKIAHASELVVPNFGDPLTIDPRGILVDG